MKCPSCQSEEVKVTDSRQKDTRRYRKRTCKECGHHFATTEVLGTVKTDFPLFTLNVIKKSGKFEKFERDKLMQSISVAIRKAKRSHILIDEIMSQIEQEIHASSLGEPVASATIGNLVLQALKARDRLAYLRYWSVHQNIETDEEVQSLIDELQALLAAGKNV